MLVVLSLGRISPVWNGCWVPVKDVFQQTGGFPGARGGIVPERDSRGDRWGERKGMKRKSRAHNGPVAQQPWGIWSVLWLSTHSSWPEAGKRLVSMNSTPTSKHHKARNMTTTNKCLKIHKLTFHQTKLIIRSRHADIVTLITETSLFSCGMIKCVQKQLYRLSLSVFWWPVDLRKYTETVGRTQTVHYQNLPQKCKPQQREREPNLAASWETAWDGFTLVQSSWLVRANIFQWEPLTVYHQ